MLSVFKKRKLSALASLGIRVVIHDPVILGERFDFDGAMVVSSAALVQVKVLSQNMVVLCNVIHATPFGA